MPMSGMTAEERKAAAEHFRRTGQRPAERSANPAEESRTQWPWSLISHAEDLPTITIPRAEVLAMKRVLQRERGQYGEILRTSGHPAAVLRVATVRGTPSLLYLRLGLMLLTRLMPVVAIALWVFVGLTAAVACVLIWFVVLNPIQTHLNYEIAARLFALDQRMSSPEG